MDELNVQSQFVLSQCESRKALKQKLTEMTNYAKYGLPSWQGSRVVYGSNSGLQAQSVVYFQEGGVSESGPRTVLIDPNTLSADGTVSLSGRTFSEDGRFCSYGLSVSGSDWITVKVLEITADGKACVTL